MEDENDEIPQFVGLDENGRYSGSVAENLDPGAEVITVTANDRDTILKYRQVDLTYMHTYIPTCNMHAF